MQSIVHSCSLKNSIKISTYKVNYTNFRKVSSIFPPPPVSNFRHHASSIHAVSCFPNNP